MSNKNWELLISHVRVELCELLGTCAIVLPRFLRNQLDLVKTNPRAILRETRNLGYCSIKNGNGAIVQLLLWLKFEKVADQ